MSITELINDIKKNNLILPEFQRGYVWRATQVREYLASLYRGYPTGSFLIWKTPNPGLVRGAPTEDAAFQLILDGQQRLTSVYALVTGEPPPFYEGEELYFNIYFNVVTEEFSYYKKQLMSGSPEWLPVTPFLKLGLGDYFKKGGPVDPEVQEFLFPAFFPRLTQLDAIHKYAYYLDVLSERNMDEVVRIFDLVNSRGTRLGKSDIALSRICALWPEARREMRAAQAEFKEHGLRFDLSFFVRCTASVATGSGRYEPLYRSGIDEIKAAWHNAKKALEYLANVLRHDAFIDDPRQLPTDIALVPLIVHLANNDCHFANDGEKRRFLHWFYAALMWARYSGSSETKLDQDIRALAAEDPPARLRENLISDVGRIRVEASDLEGRGTASPFAVMCYVVARANSAVDWFNGLPLYSKLVGKSNGLERHHIFPTSLLYKKAGFSSANKADVSRVNELANIAFLTKEANLKAADLEPAKHIPTVLSAHPDALKQQNVPEAPALWDIDHYGDFLAERRKRLAQAINDFMEDLLKEQPKTEWTIADYISAGESQTVEFKESLRWNYKANMVDKALEKTVARTVAGFMNHSGGTLVIGVTDSGGISGIERDFESLKHKDRDGWEQNLVSTLGGYLSKEVAAVVDISFAEVDGRTVSVLHANPSTKPIFLYENDAAEFHVRSGNTTQLLDAKQALEYIKQHFPA
jgi:hypothetical protein